jgi:flagellar biosynthesis anti-sigma factor FlgM
MSISLARMDLGNAGGIFKKLWIDRSHIAMDIKKIIGNDASLGSAQTRKTNVKQYQEQQSNQASREGLDTVTISDQSRQLSRISAILERDEIARESKIAALKEKVQNGSYSVDSREVARSLISFAADTESEI